eukprot:TRINITY_DN12081_c0_g1_i1.p1 TRINITY_DN12081_c0_g1~~TRINITY_DN12081_c0_g1_i1.p1  ORF type:complete len:241 (-),score=50.04 TRINITY_DN12081_c0_g1_i1:123-809(-)
MSRFYCIQKEYSDIIPKYYSAIQEAIVSQRELENAASMMQRVWRRHKTICFFDEWAKYISEYISTRKKRQNIVDLLKKHIELRDNEFKKKEGEYAIQIQRHWNGFFVRKYIYDYYERKRYLDSLKIINAEMETKLEQYNNQQKDKFEEEQQRNMETKVAELASNLHHLTSTKNISGVYNPPGREPPVLPHAGTFIPAEHVISMCTSKKMSTERIKRRKYRPPQPKQQQ